MFNGLNEINKILNKKNNINEACILVELPTCALHLNREDRIV